MRTAYLIVGILVVAALLAGERDVEGRVLGGRCRRPSIVRSCNCSGTSVPRPTPGGPGSEAPESTDTARTADNLFSGLRHVKYTDFHVIAVFAADDDPKTHKAMSKDLEELRKLFNFFQDEVDSDADAARSPAPKILGSMKVFFSSPVGKSPEPTSVPATKSAILNYIKSMPSAAGAERLSPDGVILFWSDAHGRDNDILLTEKDEKGNPERITRAELLKTIASVEKRLAVVITQNCNSGASLPEALPRPRDVQGIWRQLYFGHEGLVNIASCEAGENSYFVSDRGGVFLTAFAKTFEVQKEKLVKDPRGVIVVRWENFFYGPPGRPVVPPSSDGVIGETAKAFADLLAELKGNAANAEVLKAMEAQGVQVPILIGADQSPPPFNLRPR